MRTALINGAFRPLPTRSHDREAGYTLLEIAVVVLILGLLFSFGIPSFLGARTRAHDAAAFSSLRATAIAGIATSDLRSDFRLASDTDLSTYEPSLAYVDAASASTGPHVASIDATERDRWVAAVRSESGTCFAVVAGPFGQTAPEPSDCIAANVTTAAPEPSIRQLAHSGPITSTTAGMCLEVVGTQLEQQPCSNSQPPLLIETGADGYSTLSLTDGTCFGTTGPQKAARVVEELCTGGDDQLWEVVPSFEGTVQFKNKETGWCLDVYGASSSAGADLIQWGYGTPPNGTCKPTTSANNHNFGYG